MRLRPCFASAALLFSGIAAHSQPSEPLAWPEVSQSAKPWTRWWWQGSAVDEANLEWLLARYAEAGLGGVEITPIYGVRGYEDQFVSYLSPEWVSLLETALQQAERHGLGVDMATGTGWPFGGPMVTAEDACRFLAHKTYSLSEGERLDEPVSYTQETIVRSVTNQIYTTVLGKPSANENDQSSAKDPQLRRDTRPLEITDLVEPISENENLQALALDQIRFPKPIPLQTLVAYSEDGRAIKLTDRVQEDGTLDWTAPDGNWTLYALFAGWHGKMVERAAPGGEGNVIDHFAKAPIRNYLEHFDAALKNAELSNLRAYFNDSYEVDDARGQADWTPDLLDRFENLRGYDLRDHLPALFGNDDADTNARVLADYRLTVSDLLLETFTEEWAQWANDQNRIIRNQAHGSPANILDLYAASDIPETESIDPLRVKWGTSSASVTGKPLVSAEAATWLDEHFLPTLDSVRQALDHFFLRGVNHIVYHGTNYSPEEAEWPGWLFYAATHFNERNSWWPHFPALNQYVTRVQSFLQLGQPDNDVLLYFPAYADYAHPSRSGEMLKHYGEGNQHIDGSTFLDLYRFLGDAGYAFDFVSDRQLAETSYADSTIQTSGNQYRAIVVPETDYIPLETFNRLAKLADEGATVIFHQSYPADVAGLANLDSNRTAYRELLAEVPGRIAADFEGLAQLLAQANAAPEALTRIGLSYVRRKVDDGYVYFIANRTENDRQGSFSLRRSGRSAALFDPMSGNFGYARYSPSRASIQLDIPAGESRIVRLSPHAIAESSQPYPRYDESEGTIELTGPATLKALSGGPTLPETRSLDQVLPWTDLESAPYSDFSGVASYTLTFRKPQRAATHWRLDLGEVYQSAEVILNGDSLGILIGPNYELVFESDKLMEDNSLEIRVANRMANRIAHLDRKGVYWKRHYNVNFPARRSTNRGSDGLFTAKNWTPLSSGLAGPITLTPLAIDSP